MRRPQFTIEFSTLLIHAFYHAHGWLHAVAIVWLWGEMRECVGDGGMVAFYLSLFPPICKNEIKRYGR